MTYQDLAVEFFDGHFNCAQSVFGSFSDYFGLDRETAFRTATPFGGGIGHSGEMCGAVSGAIMVIGLARGFAVYDKEEKEACYDLAHAFIERFNAQYGTLSCPGLLGMDIRDPEALEQARELNLFHTRCPQFVRDASRIVAELLELESSAEHNVLSD